MLRSAPSRTLLRGLRLSARQQPFATIANGSASKPRALPLFTGAGPVSPRILPNASSTTSLGVTFLRSYAQTKWDKPDAKAEKAAAKERLDAEPELVSSTSSVHPLFSEIGEKDGEPDTQMMSGIRGDLNTIKETFDLATVPREAFVIGLAGTLPYLATSLSTVFCAWEINHAVANVGLVMQPKTAESLLHILEPLQIGYGAVIVSFLGAIHWGLEWAGYGGRHGYKRYAIGVVAPAVAWPTLLLPIEYALITQFIAFTFLYYVDVRATVRGWTPPWYSTYRFVLTFIVGASIVVSLIGRGEIADKVRRIPTPIDRYMTHEQDAEDEFAKVQESASAGKSSKVVSSDNEKKGKDEKAGDDKGEDELTGEGGEKDEDGKEGDGDDGDGGDGEDKKSKDSKGNGDAKSNDSKDNADEKSKDSEDSENSQDGDGEAKKEDTTKDGQKKDKSDGKGKDESKGKDKK